MLAQRLKTIVWTGLIRLHKVSISNPLNLFIGIFYSLLPTPHSLFFFLLPSRGVLLYALTSKPSLYDRFEFRNFYAMFMFNKLLDIVAILPQSFIDPFSIVAVAIDVHQRLSSIG